MRRSNARIHLTQAPDADRAASGLVGRLVQGSEAGSPFERPPILVPRGALERHLTLAVARQAGVAASLRVMSPVAWIEEIFGLHGEEGLWRPATLTWSVFETLGSEVHRLPPMLRHVADHADPLPRLEFARRAADRFYAYLLYRPEILHAWEDGRAVPGLAAGHDHEGWQRLLWTHLVSTSGTHSPARRVADALADIAEPPEGLPNRLYLLTDPLLPPTIRALLLHLGRWCEIEGWITDHAPEAPAHLSAPAQRAALRALEAETVAAGGTFSWHRASDRAPDRAPDRTRDGTSSPRPAQSLLEAVQAVYRGDAAALNEAAESAQGSGPSTSEAAAHPHPHAHPQPRPRSLPLDDSLSLHRCHSALRELEVLREQALQALASDPQLRPHDITLYVTSLERYLPAIETVLGEVDGEGAPALPYSVAGLPFRDRSQVAAACLRVIEACDGRGSLREVADLLALEPIAMAAGLSTEEVPIAVGLVQRAGVHWGWDPGERADRYGIPEIADGTWAQGLDRLVLGLATGPDEHDVEGLVPHAGDTATHAPLLARLIAWTDHMTAAFAMWRTPRPAGQWPAAIEGALRSIVHLKGIDEERILRSLRETLDAVVAPMQRANPDAVVDFKVIRSSVERAFGEATGFMGHLRGGMRVCALTPGAVLRAPVVLVAGMSDEAYPQGRGALSWDLLTATRDGAIGVGAEDPDARERSLHAFRHLICSAGRRLHVSWTGVTLSRQEMRAASVGLSELETVASEFLAPDDRRILIRRREPAHPFSEELFRGGGVGGGGVGDDGSAGGPASAPGRATPSTSERWAEAARNLRRTNRTPWLFVEEGAAVEAEPLPPVLSLGDLARCIENPTRYFCERVLGLHLRQVEGVPQDEPQKGESRAWEYRKLSYRLEAAQRRGDRRSRAALEAWLRAQPELPLGAAGEDRAVGLLDVRGWWSNVEAMREIPWIPPRRIRLACGPWQIEGRLDRLTPVGRCLTGFFELGKYSAVQHWVHHLALCAHGAERLGVEPVTIVATPAPWRFRAVEPEEAAALLLELCEVFVKAHEGPLPLFRRAGVSLLEAKSESSAVKAAQAAWRGRPPAPGEKYEPEHQLCWPDRNFIRDAHFYEEAAAWARTVLQPLLSAADDALDPSACEADA
jgi:exodeoxyribonuclease V gamma subunit